MIRLRLAAALAAVLVAGLALAAGAGAAVDGVSVTVDRARVATQLGRKFDFQTTVANDGLAPSARLIAHLNVLSLGPGVYVDPEDWSSDRVHYLGSLPAGESRTITWNIHAVNDGRFAAYVTVLPENVGDQAPTTSAVVEFDVQKRTTLNSGGILPLALGIPAILLLLTLGTRTVRGRR
jgi:hypothetical protein